MTMATPQSSIPILMRHCTVDKDLGLEWPLTHSETIEQALQQNFEVLYPNPRLKQSTRKPTGGLKLKRERTNEGHSPVA